MSLEVQTREGTLILDSHKLSYHMDRVLAWEAGERIAPVSVDMSLTRSCGAMCSFCYAMMQESQARSSISTSQAMNLLDDFAEIGIRSVSLVSDGESSLSKAYVPFIQHAAKLGIDVANATNAWEWEPDHLNVWRFLQNTVDISVHYSGRSQVFYWMNNGDVHRNNPKSRIQGALCVNIDVASNKEVNYGIFKSSDGRRVKKSLAA